MKKSFVTKMILAGFALALMGQTIGFAVAGKGGSKDPYSITYSKCYNDLASKCIPAK